MLLYSSGLVFLILVSFNDIRYVLRNATDPPVAIGVKGTILVDNMLALRSETI